MTKRQGKSGTIDVKAILAEDEEFLRALVRTALQEVLEVEMTEALGAEKGERAAGRQGYRSGYYGRMLITRVGQLELRVPQDRSGRFSTELFERYQRSERALVAALAEMYVQGVSTRKSLPSRKRGWTTTACKSCAGSEPVLGPAKPDPGDRRDLPEARRDLAAWLAKWSGKYSKLTGWVEENIDETLTPAFAGAGSFTGCRGSTISTSNRPICWSD